MFLLHNIIYLFTGNKVKSFNYCIFKVKYRNNLFFIA